jgi:hypothetical protein
VYREIDSGTDRDETKFQIGLTIWSRNTSDITNRVRVNAALGDDIIHVQTAAEVSSGFTVLGGSIKGNAAVNKVVQVNCDSGTDTVWGGDQADEIYGVGQRHAERA